MIIVTSAAELADLFKHAAQQLRGKGDLATAELADEVYHREDRRAGTDRDVPVICWRQVGHLVRD